jgi:paraquat-inducible protein B
MTDGSDEPRRDERGRDEPGRGEPPEARVRRRRWLAWVWVVPIASAAIVIWLGWRTISERGPAITISFRNAQGLQPGQTRIQHRNAEIGTVESLELSPDMSRVIVHARVSRNVEPYLNDNTRFYVVVPRVGVGGISGLSTIISGSYIEMYPGKDGGPRRSFVGLDEPPVLPPDTPGTEFALRTTDLGSLSRGSPITYRGVNVGEVVSYGLDPDGHHVNVTAFVRSPHDQLVHAETRFWNAGGVDVSIGAQGLRFRATSWTQLLTGGIAFETPDNVLTHEPSAPGAVFALYDNRRVAMRAAPGPRLMYVADFEGDTRGVADGTPVELEGTEIGDVTAAQLRYDEHRHTLVTRVTFSIDPAKVSILDMPGPNDAQRGEKVTKWLEELVAHGLRAEVTSVSLITGFRLISLTMVDNAPPEHLRKVGNYTLMPSASGSDLNELLRSARGVLRNIDHATAGPQLGHAVKSLDETLTRLDDLTRDVGPDIKSLVKSLRETSDAAQSTLSSMQGLMGRSGAGDSDLPRLMNELTQAARTIRALADYLDRHPDALLRGRRGGQQ